MEFDTVNIKNLPVIALRGLTIFPGMMLHFDVGREASVNALEAAMAADRKVFLVAQKDLAVEEPGLRDLCKVGTIATVQQTMRLSNTSNVRVMVEGHGRGKIVHMTQETPYLAAEVESLPEQLMPEQNSARVEALVRQTYELFERYAELSDRMTPDVMIQIMETTDPGQLADYVAQNLVLRGEDKQTVLDELRPVQRLTKLNQILRRENRILELDQELQNKVKERMDDNQRDYYLREQIKVIQAELGEGEGSDGEIGEYRKKIAASHLSDEIKQKLEKELRRLEKQPFGSAEAAVQRNYLDLCLELPCKKSKERINVEQAKKILNADHEGMEKVKERILEFVAVKQLAPQLKGQIICLYGPPGVGKTSIASSLAKAMNRKFARVSLGGIHDEAEIRGHRKTYVGAMPGRIVNALIQAGTTNPLILLDEIDKVGSDGRSDPAAALLEVLDAEQNATFRDNFVEFPLDLSDVLFITTANDLGPIPRPLLDRMEVIELESYTDEEKLAIAKKHLLPRELSRHGLKKSQLKISDDTIRAIITGYTRESGVRRLEQEFAALCRKTAMELVTGKSAKVVVTKENLEYFLGTRKFSPELRSGKSQVGVVNGLAWTSVGGTLLEVEVNVVPGTGKIELTGNLGNVMKESCQAAISYLRSHTETLGIAEDFYKTKDIHVHFPEGAVPKDGPSAGVTITTALTSALTGIPVRGDVAMTGEVSLRGRVLAIGGLREKTMAAYRNGIRTVIIPKENEKDLADIDQTVRAALRFVPAEQVDQVLAEALCTSPAAGHKTAPAEQQTAAADRATSLHTS